VNLKFKHLGVAVPDLSKALAVYRDVFGYRMLSGPYADPVQKVSVCFLGGATNEPQIELVAPLTEGSPVQNILKKGGGPYHLCYESDNLDDAMAELVAKGCLIVSEPVPAVAFAGRRIAWLFTPTRQLLELVES
jgi:methylmalonyl-CoA/ethylmalonyl-CoA epimerase